MQMLQQRAGVSSVRGAAQQRRSVVARAVARPLWLPGSKVPAHLDGSLPGDFGFDPLGLGKDPASLRWYHASEVFHGRLAMTAVAGVLFTSIANKLGTGIPEWYDAGKVYAERPDAIPQNTLLAIEFFLCHWVETKRGQDILAPGSQAEKGSFVGLETAFTGTGGGPYPGGPFDFLGLSRQSPAEQAEWKLREIKNGRLAMLAFIGFAAQHSATGKGPIDNLIEHVKDPWHVTFAENGVSVPFL